jgi:phosphate transport system substrate-binding protein
VKRNRRCLCGCGFSVVLVALILLKAPVFGEELVIPGTGACEPILAELAAAFSKANPGDQVSVPPSNGSGGGINAVLKGEASLARVARPLKEKEEQQGLVYLMFARDAVAFVVGKDVSVSNLTTGQVIDIFSGAIEKWQDVGGGKGSIRVITREPGDSSLAVIQEHIKEFKNLQVAPKAKVIMYDQATVETLDKYKNSVGFITMSSKKWGKGGIKTVSFDSVAPSRDNIVSGKYRLVENYAFVYKKSLAPAAGKFVDFVFSKEGKKIMEGNGLIVADKKPER